MKNDRHSLGGNDINNYSTVHVFNDINREVKYVRPAAEIHLSYEGILDRLLLENYNAPKKIKTIDTRK